MQMRQGYTVEGLHAVRTFLADNADRLPAVVETGAFQRLCTLIDQLAEHAAEQAGAGSRDR